MVVDSQSFEQLCLDIKRSSNNNDHTNSKLLVAKYFKLNHFIKVFEFIKYMHIVDGSMLPDLESLRKRESKRMMLEVEEILSDRLDVILFEKLKKLV